LKIFLFLLYKRQRDIFLYVFSGANVKEYFSQEIGGHRIQRIPITESKGRVHTSSVTVAVMEPGEQTKIKLNPNDIKIQTMRGRGNGGQKKNVTDSCVVVKHIPTGFVVRCEKERSQIKNKEFALEELTKRVQDLYNSKTNAKEVINRREQIGTGSRSEKRRTYTFKSDTVIDHVSEKRASLKMVFKGNLKLLHI